MRGGIRMYNNKKIFPTIKLFAEATIIIQHVLEWPVLYYYYYYTHSAEFGKRLEIK